MEQVERTVPSVSKRIEELCRIMKHLHEPSEVASKINDILIYGDKIPISLLKPSWDYFAKSKGVTTQ